MNIYIESEDSKFSHNQPRLSKFSVFDAEKSVERQKFNKIGKNSPKKKKFLTRPETAVKSKLTQKSVNTKSVQKPKF